MTTRRRDARALIALIALIGGCHRALPSAVSLPDPEARPATGLAWSEVDTLDDAITAICGTDPLCRRPRLPGTDEVQGFDGALPLRRMIDALSAVPREAGALAAGLQRAHAAAPGTAVVPIVRGYRFGVAERMIVEVRDLPETDPGRAQLAPLLSELTPIGAQRLAPAGDPLAFLTRSGALTYPVAVRQLGERWVLAGWLDGPDVPTGPAAAALDGSPFDALRGQRLAQLVAARAADAPTDAGPIDAGRADLVAATALSLQRVAADRSREQGAWLDARKAATDRLGDPDPEAFLLRRAVDTLTPQAGDRTAVAGALTALAALRLLERCDAAPCVGLDRVDALAAVPRWSEALAPTARAWRVIALKEAMDAMEVGHDTALFRTALVDLVDALIGTGAGPMAADVLAWRTPAPELWGALGGALGDASPDSWPSFQLALGAHLAEEVRAAQADADPTHAPWLEIIGRRALP